jgi:hypothetical protein
MRADQQRERMTRTAKVGFGLLGAIVTFVFLGEMLAHYGTGGSGRYSSQWVHPGPLSSALATSQAPRVADSLSVAVRPHAGTFDSVFVADITITNRSASAVANVAIACDALGENGSATGHATATLHGIFAAHTTTTESNVELRFVHRPASARCAVASSAARP